MELLRKMESPKKMELQRELEAFMKSSLQRELKNPEPSLLPGETGVTSWIALLQRLFVHLGFVLVSF